MIILYDPSNDRYGGFFYYFFFFAQLVFSTYLSVVLLNTSHNFKGEGQKFGTTLVKNALQEFHWVIFKYKPNRTLTFRSVTPLI